MDIGLLVPTADESAPQATSSMLNETGQCQQLSQSGVFSALLKDAAKKMDDSQTPPIPVTDHPIEPAFQTVTDGRATEAAVTVIGGEAVPQLCDLQSVAAPSGDRAERLPDSTGCNRRGIDSMPLIPQRVAEGVPPDNSALEAEPLSDDLPQAGTAGSPQSSALQPLIDQAQSGGAPAMDAKQTASPIPGEPSLWKGLAAVPMEQPIGDSELLEKLPPDSLTSWQKPASNLEQQGGRTVPSTASVMGDLQSLNRPSPGTRPSLMIQEQGEPEAMVPGQALSIRPVAGSGGGGQDPFGTSTQGGGDWFFFQSGASEVSETGMRGTQPTVFNEQFTSARQTQFLPQGAIASSVTPAADQLKLAQAFLGESHPADVTAPRGMAQTVHVVLPSHEAGPLSVRISMVDQTVHTQFTTDRSDLGTILMGRQDQLQQNLTKSGLELGQFQVHINQEGRQDAFPDRQSRRNGDASEQQPASQDQNRQPQDRERPQHGSQRALSLFA
jgi:hypothetical protein